MGCTVDWLLSRPGSLTMWWGAPSTGYWVIQVPSPCDGVHQKSCQVPSPCDGVHQKSCQVPSPCDGVHQKSCQVPSPCDGCTVDWPLSRPGSLTMWWGAPSTGYWVVQVPSPCDGVHRRLATESSRFPHHVMGCTVDWLLSHPGTLTMWWGAPSTGYWVIQVPSPCDGVHLKSCQVPSPCDGVHRRLATESSRFPHHVMGCTVDWLLSRVGFLTMWWGAPEELSGTLTMWWGAPEELPGSLTMWWGAPEELPGSLTMWWGAPSTGYWVV